MSLCCPPIHLHLVRATYVPQQELSYLGTYVIAAWRPRQCPNLTKAAPGRKHLVRASYVPQRKLPYPSACCLYCRAQSAVPEVQESSTRSQIFATGYCCPYRGSWPPSDLLPNRCMLLRTRGSVLMSFHRPLPGNHRFFSAILMQTTALPGARMALATKGIQDCTIHSKG